MIAMPKSATRRTCITSARQSQELGFVRVFQQPKATRWTSSNTLKRWQLALNKSKRQDHSLKTWKVRTKPLFKPLLRKALVSTSRTRQFATSTLSNLSRKLQLKTVQPNRCKSSIITSRPILKTIQLLVPWGVWNHWIQLSLDHSRFLRHINALNLPKRQSTEWRARKNTLRITKGSSRIRGLCNRL